MDGSSYANRLVLYFFVFFSFFSFFCFFGERSDTDFGNTRCYLFTILYLLLRYKYLISLDGNSYANRLIKLLATNSLVVKENTPTRQAIEFYYHMLQPGVHYLPFDIKTDQVIHIYMHICIYR